MSDICNTCNGSGQIIEEHEDGLQFRIPCPSCDGCGKKHAGISRDELRREGYTKEGGEF